MTTEGLDVSALPPWDCCGSRGEHGDGCAYGAVCGARFHGSVCERAAGHSGRHRHGNIRWSKGEATVEINLEVDAPTSVPCPARHPVTLQRCILTAGHRGIHRGGNGNRWVA